MQITYNCRCKYSCIHKWLTVRERHALKDLATLNELVLNLIVNGTISATVWLMKQVEKFARLKFLCLVWKNGVMLTWRGIFYIYYSQFFATNLSISRSFWARQMCLLQKSHRKCHWKCHSDISAVIEECQTADAHFSKRTVDREIRPHVRPSLPESVCFADF